MLTFWQHGSCNAGSPPNLSPGKNSLDSSIPCGCVLRYWLTRLPCKIPTQFNDSTRIPLGHGPLPTTVANENLWESPNPYKKCHHSGGHCCTQDSTDSIGSPFVLRHLGMCSFHCRLLNSKRCAKGGKRSVLRAFRHFAPVKWYLWISNIANIYIYTLHTRNSIHVMLDPD